MEHFRCVSEFACVLEFVSALSLGTTVGKKLQSEEFSRYQEVYNFVKKKKKKETAFASFVQPSVKFGLIFSFLV